MSVYSDLILAESSLQSYWKLDEASGSPADSKASLSGTTSGTLTYAQTGYGVIGNAILSNGANPTRISFGDNYRFSGTSAFTLECWIKLNGDTGGRFIAKFDENFGNGYVFAMGSSKLYGLRHNGTTSEDVTGTTTLTDGVWYHVALVFTGSQLRLYVNGVLDASVTSTASIGSPTSKPFTIFGTSDTSMTAATFYLGCYMQHVAVYNAALSASSLLAHYNAGVTVAKSASDSITATDSASVTQTVPVTASDSVTATDTSAVTVTGFYGMGAITAGDTCTGSSGTDLASHSPTGPYAAGSWVNVSTNGSYAIKIRGNRISGATVTGSGGVTPAYNHSADLLDGYIEAVATVVSAGGYAELHLRKSGTTQYLCVIDNGGNGTAGRIELYKYPAGTLLGTWDGWATGDVIRAEAVSGAVKVYVNGTQRISYTDGSPLSTGKPGVGFYTTEGSAENCVALDDIVIYDASAVGAAMGAETATATEGSSVSDGTVAKTASETVTATDASAVLRQLGGTASTPQTRSAYAAAVTVAAAGTVGTSSAHNAFPVGVRAANGDLLIFYKAAVDHGAIGEGKCRRSTDGGATWGSETTPLAGVGYGIQGVRKLASGRLAACVNVVTGSIGSPFDRHYVPHYSYSDDHGATWSTPVAVTHAFGGGNCAVGDGAALADDIVELANGDLVLVMYGGDYHPYIGVSGVTFYLRASKSTDGGATWTPLATVATVAQSGGYNAVEAQIARLSTGTLVCIYHSEDGVPTDVWRTTSTDGGATWSTPARIHTSESANRTGMVLTDDGDMVEAYYDYASTFSMVIRQSTDGGATWGSRIAAMSAPGGLPNTVWSSPFVIGNQGASPNLGVAMAWENGGQNQASVYFRQFTAGATVGIGTDTATATDASSVTVGVGAIAKTASDSASVTDTATRSGVTRYTAASDSALVYDSSGNNTSAKVPARILRDTYVTSSQFGSKTVSSDTFGDRVVYVHPESTIEFT